MLWHHFFHYLPFSQIKFSHRLKGHFSLLQLGLYFGNNNILFTKLIAESWKHGDIAKNKSDRARNTNIQMIIQVLNKQTRPTCAGEKKKTWEPPRCLHLSQFTNQLPSWTLTYHTCHSYVQFSCTMKDYYKHFWCTHFWFYLHHFLIDLSCNKLMWSFNIYK